ncbi:MAG: chemotaxis protein CheW [SAR324 cluster bacterium]|nr:chemotaxis protein CheW [SAR324 cluster bacterium]
MRNKAENDILPVLIVSVGGEKFAILVATIHEVVPLMTIEHIPGAPVFLEGFIDIRGDLYVVVDLSKYYFKRAREAYIRDNRIILASVHGKNLGFIVDEIITLDEWTPDMRQPGIMTEGIHALTGEIGKTMFGDIQVLNLDRILSEQELSLLARRNNL